MPKFSALVQTVSIAIFFALLIVPGAKSTKVFPPSIEDLSGNWLGQSDNGEFVRLQLDRTGRGMLALNYYPKQPVWRYNVVVTKSEKNPLGYDLSISASPIGHKKSLRIVEAVGFRNRVNFQLAGDPFTSVYSLTPEIEALNRIKKLIRTSKVK